MARDLVQQSIAIISVLTVLSPGTGEQFFQYRDHRDQALYDVDKKTVAVHNTFEAELQLEKYGYLRCRVKRRKRSIFPGFELSEGKYSSRDGDNLPLCSDSEVQQAIRQYQKTYNLPESGVIDKQTRTLMSTSRCGNADTKTDDVLPDAIENIEKSTQEMLHDFVKQNSLSNNNDKFKSRPWKRSTGQSQLMRVIAGKDTVSSLERRKQYLHEYIARLKNEDPLLFSVDKNDDENNRTNRQKRSVIIEENRSNTSLADRVRLDSHKFEKQVITWRLLNSGYSTRIPEEDQRATLDLAFRMWSEVIPLKFKEETGGDIQNVDIEVSFGKGSHQNCRRAFDGQGGEIAHSFHTGNMHFDDEENFKSLRSFTPDGVYLLKVAVHEIGHVLGLLHTEKKYSIMYAIYEAATASPDFELNWEDRKAVQRVYGVCKGRFNAVFDWVRKRPDNQFIFNTYFFRGNHYWMYENHANRTRYGDPLYIAREWNGVPNNLDSYAHIWYFSGNDIVDEAYFFKGDKYYMYQSEEDRVYDGWPHLIQDDFGPKPGQTESIPINLNSVFFDMRDKNLYFFKDEWVYVFDPKLPKGERGCCERKRKLQEEFPAEEGSEPLPDRLDVVFYSYKDQSVYFFKDEDVWQNVPFHPRQKQIKNSVKYLGKWYDKWYDICDVSAGNYHSTHVFQYNHETIRRR